MFHCFKTNEGERGCYNEMRERGGVVIMSPCGKEKER